MAAYWTGRILWTLTLLFFTQAAIGGNRTPEGEATFLDNESKLFTDLLADYNRYIRPAVDAERVNVSVGLSILHINGVDEKVGTLNVQGWLRMMWQDARLSWDSEKYGGISTIRIPPKKLWTPDITLYNSATDTTALVGETSQLALITSSGHIVWVPQAILHSKCTLDMSYFPFDKQLCALVFGSWTYNGNQLAFELYQSEEEIDTLHFSEHIEWDIHGTAAGITAKKYPCCPETYPEVRFNLTLSRKRTYYSYMYIAPPLMISHLIPLMFVLPALKAHRYILGMGIVITMTLQLENIAWVMPSLSGDIPVLCRYYIGVFVMSFLSLLCSALITNLAYRAKGPEHPLNIVKVVSMNPIPEISQISNQRHRLIGFHVMTILGVAVEYLTQSWEWSVLDPSFSFPALWEIVVSDIFGRLLCVPRTNYTHMSAYSRDTDEVEVTEPEAGARKRPKDVDEISEWSYIAKVLDRFFALIFSILVASLAVTHLFHS